MRENNPPKILLMHFVLNTYLCAWSLSSGMVCISSVTLLKFTFFLSEWLSIGDSFWLGQEVGSMCAFPSQ